MSGDRKPSVIVGVTPAQPATVIATAAEFARHFDADLICVSVNEARHEVAHAPDGTVTSMSFDSDLVDTNVEVFDSKLTAKMATVLDATGVSWSTRALAGDAAGALTNLAEKTGAAMIVVGTRQASVRGNMREFFNGSVAVRLVHRQRRPVVVIPLSPVPHGEALPWEPK